MAGFVGVSLETRGILLLEVARATAGRPPPGSLGERRSRPDILGSDDRHRDPAVPRWSLAIPVLGVLVLAVAWGRSAGPVLLVLVCAGLAGSVVAAVHHAEVVAHRVGEPFGTLILALAVTVIEMALIVTLMVSGGDEAASLARDTVFAAMMIACNGVVGMALVLGPLRHRVLEFNVEGSGARADARDGGRRPGGAAQPAPDEPQPRAGVGPGEHRADDPRHRHCVDLAGGSARARARRKEMVLWALTVVVSVLTLATGRATLLQGAVHLMTFSAFLFLAFTP